MVYLITGGSGSGKSEYAENLLCSFRKDRTEQSIYVATMFPYGDETKEKIRRHRQMRKDKGFETIERYTDLAGIAGELKKYNSVSVLIECISNLVSNEMFFPDICSEKQTGIRTDDGRDIRVNGRVEDRMKRREGIAHRILEGVEIIRQAAQNVVIVTNEVNSEGLAYTPEMIDYKRTMGEVNCRLAEMADEVAEIVYGIKAEVKSRL